MIWQLQFGSRLLSRKIAFALVCAHPFCLFPIESVDHALAGLRLVVPFRCFCERGFFGTFSLSLACVEVVLRPLAL